MRAAPLKRPSRRRQKVRSEHSLCRQPARPAGNTRTFRGAEPARRPRPSVSPTVPTEQAAKVPAGPGCSGKRVARSAPPQPSCSESGSRPLPPGLSGRLEASRVGSREKAPLPLPPQGRLGSSSPRRRRESAPSFAVPPAGCVGRLGGLHQPRLYSNPWASWRGGVGNAEPVVVPAPDVRVGGEEGTAGEESAGRGAGPLPRAAAHGGDPATAAVSSAAGEGMEGQPRNLFSEPGLLALQ